MKKNTKGFLLNAPANLFKDLDKYVDGVKYASRTHLIISILKDWIDQRKIYQLKSVKKTTR